MTILGFSRIGINSDSWCEEQKPTGMRFYYKTNEKTKGHTDNAELLETAQKQRDSAGWGGGHAH